MKAHLDKINYMRDHYFYILEDRDINKTYSPALEEEGLLIVKLDGNLLQSKNSLFSHFASALNFPEYFGYNWDAFDECINDLEWISEDVCLLLISNANKILSSENIKELSTFYDILKESLNEWNLKYTLKKPQILRVVLSAEKDKDPELEYILLCEGLEFKKITSLQL